MKRTLEERFVGKMLKTFQNVAATFEIDLI